MAGLLFAGATTFLASNDIADGIPRCGKKPAAEHGIPRDPVRVPGKGTEHKLGDILSMMCVATESAERRGMHEGQVTAHDLGKRGLIAIRGVAVEQCAVVVHLLIYNHTAEPETGQQFLSAPEVSATHDRIIDEKRAD